METEGAPEMSNTSQDRAAAARQVQQRIESLQAAGVEFLPGPDRSLFPPEPVTVETKSSLFGDGTEFKTQADPTIRRQSLALLVDEVRECMACEELYSTRTQTVFGVGPMDPELCFIGEAPGADEDRQGEPFVGAAGQLLTKIIAACGMKREDVYICNILKCRPPGNRTPKPNEAANCRGFLDRQLELIGPKFICCLGATAAQYLLKTRTPIGKMRGRFFDYHGTPVICTYHPASLLPHRSPENKKLVWEDMKLLLEKMGRPIPATGQK
jgi:uracil-DNA glycosylase